MPKRSKIELLGPELRELIGRLWEQGRTISEITDHLKQLDADVGRTGVGTYIQRLQAVGEQMRQQREVVDALVSRWGEGAENKITRFNAQLLQGALTRCALAEDGTEVRLEPKEAALLAKALKDVTAAERNDAAIILRLREEAKKAAQEKALAAMDLVAQSRGLAADDVAALKAQFLGLV